VKRKRNPSVIITAALLLVALLLAGCQQAGQGGKTLTLAINSGVEGDALKQAARDYEAQTGVYIF
jgi:ABC-type glycerol-3-phosphate transport system substrate-binding protein